MPNRGLFRVELTTTSAQTTTKSHSGGATLGEVVPHLYPIQHFREKKIGRKIETDDVYTWHCIRCGLLNRDKLYVCSNFQGQFRPSRPRKLLIAVLPQQCLLRIGIVSRVFQLLRDVTVVSSEGAAVRKSTALSIFQHEVR